MTFYKILDFKFMGRKFTAFRNSLGFQTYLEYIEINNERKYHYVDEATYSVLYNMFLKKKASFYEDGNKNGKGKNRSEGGNKTIREKFSFIPKIISSAGTLILLASLTACGVPGISAGGLGNSQSDAGPQLWPNQIFDENEAIITEDYEVYEITKSVNLLTVDGMNLYWEVESNATFEDVRQAIIENGNIDEFMEEYLLNFIDKVETRFPNISLGCFYHNVKNLNIKALSSLGMMQTAGSSSVFACFSANDCTIYYNMDKLDEENFEYIMYHEIGHMLLNGSKDVKGYDTDRHYTTGINTGYMIEEGFNTLFIEEVLGISLKDVTYRLPANYLKVMMEPVGYSLEDYVNGYHIEFENRIKDYLDDDEEYNVDNLPYLFEYQKYNIRGSNNVEMEDSEFHDLYEVVAGVYFKGNIEFCTSKEDIIALYDQLIQIITRDVYSQDGKYQFDFTGLIEGLYRALEANGIDKSIWPDVSELQVKATVGEPQIDKDVLLK